MSVIYLVRHAKSAPSESVPEPEWPLSAEGREQAEDLKKVLLPLLLDALYSSPFPRARDTLQPVANSLRLPIYTVHALRERKLCGALVADWLGELEKTWKEFDLAHPGGESSRECQNRVLGALEELAEKESGKTIAVASHGNAIALALHGLSGGAFGFEEWKAMRNPDVYRLERRAGSLQWDRSFYFR